MWTNENRALYDRSHLRYPSDLTDEEWELIEQQIPPAKRGGGKRTVTMREVVNGVMYVLSTGCQWRALPKGLPPRSTVHGYLELWNWDGTLDRIHHTLYVKCREQAQREASPTAAIIDSQSVKSAEKGGTGSTLAGMTRARKSKARSAISCRYARLADACRHPCGRYPGSRRRRSRYGEPVWPLPLSSQALRGWRLSGAAISGRAMPRHEAGQPGDREAIRYRKGVHSLAQTLDRRADHRLAEPLQEAGQRLGMLEPQRPCIPALGFHPPHAPKALQENKMISDRL